MLRVNNHSKDRDCLVITIHFGEHKYNYTLSNDKENWNENIYQDLQTAIRNYFHCISPFRLYEDIDGNQFDIDDIDDLVNAFDDNQRKKSLDLFMQQAHMPHNNIENQTSSKYKTWFDNALKLPQYYQIFINAGYIDLDYIDETIDEEELIHDLSISSKSHRQTILNEIKVLVSQRTAENTDNFDEDDQEFENGENNSWDDLELLLPNEQIVQSSFVSESPNDEFQECWQCSECDTINNVKLTMRQYHYKCCGCGDVCYIPNQTPTTYESKWDTPTDYLLKQNKIWICIKCCSSNTNMESDICEICQINRYTQNIEPNDIKCEHCNRYINPLSIITHQVHCIKDKYKTIWWVCPKCYGKETKNECKCIICGCVRPTEHNYLKIKLNGDVVFGFCRYYFAKYIPEDIKNMIIDFVDMQTFSTKTKYNGDDKKISCHYNLGFRTELFGDKYFQYPDENVWKCKLKVDPEYVVKMDGDNEAAKVYDIAIGVTFKESTFDKKTGKVNITDKYYTIKGHGRKSIGANFSHPMFRDGDVIIVELDCNTGTLSYGINENWYGVGYGCLASNTKYRLYVDVKQRGVTIQLIN